MAQETVVVPDIGSDAAEVVELLIAPGDQVAVEQGLIVLESDKASMEVPCTVAGTVVEVLTKLGDQLAEGAPVVVVELIAGAADETAGDASAAPAEAVPAAEAAASAAEAPSVPAAFAGEPVVVPVPDIGTDESVDLIEIAVQVGDEISKDDTLVVLESDKASMEVPAPQGGRVLELLISEGQQVREGDPLLRLAPSDAAIAAAPAVTAAPTPRLEPTVGSREDAVSTPTAAAPAQPGVAAAPASEVYAGPAVRRLAREFGVNLAAVRGSGPRGRILKEDLQTHVKRALEKPAGTQAGGALPLVPEVDFSAFGAVDVTERSKIDRVTADNMQRSWLNVPHVTQFDDADTTDLELFRKSLAKEAEKRGTRLTPIPFILKACAVALRRHEKINASLSDGGATLTFKRYVHIGMAVDTPAGLLVPVVRDVDQKSLWELAEEVLDLAGRARDRKLKPAEMQGASFTVSSLGALGGRGFTPIVNTPEVAILGVGKSSQQPVWDGSAFKPRLMLPLALSYDHRVVNGGDGGRFLSELVQLLGDLRRLLL
ncbi:MAG: dihydrolipoyllysine-residue acetyltransferase [Pseudomonadota bacterium]